MWKVLISNHYITENLGDVYDTYLYYIGQIIEALETNWCATCVMVRFDLNPPYVDQWRPNSVQTVTNQGVNIGEVCWGIKDSKACVGEKIEVSGRLKVEINAPGRAKMDQIHY